MTNSIILSFPRDVLKSIYNFCITGKDDQREITNLSLVSIESCRIVQEVLRDCWTGLRSWERSNPQLSNISRLLIAVMDQIEPEKKSKEEDSNYKQRPLRLFLRLKKIFSRHRVELSPTLLLKESNIERPIVTLQFRVWGF